MNYLAIENGRWTLSRETGTIATAALRDAKALRALLALTVDAEGCLDFIPASSIDTPFNGGAPIGFNAWGAIEELTEEVAPETTRVVDPITEVPSSYPTFPISTAPFTSTPPWAKDVS